MPTSARRTEVHQEPFVQLADLSHDRALIAWGAFCFTRDPDEGRWRIVPDAQLQEVNGRRTCIGQDAESYGPAWVEVRGPGGEVAAKAHTDNRTWVWVDGLEPDTEYAYRVVVDGHDWVAGERWEWGPVRHGGFDLAPAGRRYDLRFTTWPDPGAATPPVKFIALGDFGVGIGSDTESSRRQRRVAEVVDHLVGTGEARFLVSLGDTIYQGQDRHIHAGNGDRDDDWYAGFFQPYRYALARVPVFPAIGNHDTDDDGSDDREQLEDNLHLHSRFRNDTERASMSPGLFYRIQFGRDLTLVCVDTSVDNLDAGVDRLFQEPDHHAWLEDTFATSEARWTVPFSHHPSYSAGPDHGNDDDILEGLHPLFDRADVRLVLTGHEHNFQLNERDDRVHVISGAGGKVDEGAPTDFDRAGTRAWSSQAHLLLVEVDGDEAFITPYAGMLPSGEPHAMTALTRDGEVVEPPFVVHAERV